MKHLYIVILSLFPFAIQAQPMSYKDWQKEAKTDATLLPEYGGKPRTEKQKAADETYIKTTMEELHSSKESSSQQMVELGFTYLAKGDLRVAMLRFNQAWLLDPENAEVYSGFGSVYFAFMDLKKSLQYYNKGLALNPDNFNLLTYSARSYIAMFEVTKTDVESFYKALPLLYKSYSIAPQNSYTTFLLSRYYIRTNNCDSAVKYYNECKQSGGQPITDQYAAAIKNICGALMK